MAILAELGQKFPCTTQGTEIPVDDEQVDIYAGEVLEAWFESNKDINIDLAFQTLHEVLRMKEEYPHFVLHHIKVETRRISVQYSIAPMGTTASPGLLVIAAILIALAFTGIILTIGLTIRWTRGWLWSPTGNAVINAVHTETQKGISGVGIYVDGNRVGQTDGGSFSVKGLVVGAHEFAGETLEGFHPPQQVTKEIELNKTSNIDIWYRPSDIPEPKTGYLHVYTTPVTGLVYVDGEEKGPAPIALELSVGDHTVGFGPVEDYITPSPQTATIVGGQTTPITGNYTLPEEGGEWYEQLIKYALIGGGVILGAALLIPEAIRAISRRGEKKE
jgi:hypothetical protein